MQQCLIGCNVSRLEEVVGYGGKEEVVSNVDLGDGTPFHPYVYCTFNSSSVPDNQFLGLRFITPPGELWKCLVLLCVITTELILAIYSAPRVSPTCFWDVFAPNVVDV